jgi:mono/diheme cytochrome c family protein
VWDVVSYVWSLGRTPEALVRGQRLYAARCAGCHGSGGDPTDGTTAAATRPFGALSGLIEGAARSDVDLLAAVTDGVPPTAMPAFKRVLSDVERADVVSFTRTLSLEGAPGASSRPPEPDRSAAMAEVIGLVGRAIDAHRRRDPAVNSLATNAYLRFEPLEKPLAEINDAHMQALELAFERFRGALRDATMGDPQALGRTLITDLQAAADQLRPQAPPPRFTTLPTRWGWVLGSVTALAIGLVYGLLARRQ